MNDKFDTGVIDESTCHRVHPLLPHGHILLAPPLPSTPAFCAAAPMAGRPAAPWAAAVAALLGSAGRASGRRPCRRYHGRPAGRASGRRGHGAARLGRLRLRPPYAHLTHSAAPSVFTFLDQI